MFDVCETALFQDVSPIELELERLAELWHIAKPDSPERSIIIEQMLDLQDALLQLELNR